MNWETNHNSSQLPPIQVGDIIRLRFTDVFQYLVKAEVESIEGENINAIVKCVFDAPTGSEITGGEVLEIIGQKHMVSATVVQDVIKNPKSK